MTTITGLLWDVGIHSDHLTVWKRRSTAAAKPPYVYRGRRVISDDRDGRPACLQNITVSL
jgi:hypothetical protein